MVRFPPLAWLLVPVLALTGTLEPRTISWQDFASTMLDARRLLPVPGTADLEVGKKRTVDAAAHLRALLARTFPDAKEPWMRSLGNVLARLRDHNGSRPATDAVLAELERGAPAVARELSPVLAELARSEVLSGDDWDPDDDEPNDGLWCPEPWQIRVAPERGAYWNGIDADRDVCQAATMVYADLESLKRVELDYASYKTHVGSQYKQIYPIAGSYVIGKDPAGREFSSERIFFESHVPFPFSNIEAELFVYDHFADDGALLSEVYSTSADFHWLSGRDTLLPVKTTAGDFVGVLYVRQLGFDARGLPDGDSDRMKGIRAALGNKKRLAERLFAAGKKGEWTAGVLPHLPATGAK